MSIKDDIKAVKEEITAEEQFLETVIKSERFLKKYKKPLIATVSVIVAAFLIYAGYDYIKERNFKISNQAYLTLLKNPGDKKAMETLKEKNPNLYMVFLFQEAIKKNSPEAFEKILSALKDENLKDIALYQIASLKADKQALDSYSMRKEALLKDFALLDEGYLLLKEGKIKEGKEKLSMISLSSPLQNLVQSLSHYGVAKEGEIKKTENENKIEWNKK